MIQTAANSHRLTNAGAHAYGIDAELETAFDVINKRIDYLARVLIKEQRDAFLDDVLEARTMDEANQAADRLAAVFPEHAAELRRRMSDGEL